MDSILPLKSADTQISKLSLLLVEIELESLFIRKGQSMEKECSATWEPKIMVSSCQMPTKKMLSMLSSMLPLEPQDRDAWLCQLWFWLARLKNGSKIWYPRLSHSKSEQETSKESISVQFVMLISRKEFSNFAVLPKNKVPSLSLTEPSINTPNTPRVTL